MSHPSQPFSFYLPEAGARQITDRSSDPTTPNVDMRSPHWAQILAPERVLTGSSHHTSAPIPTEEGNVSGMRQGNVYENPLGSSTIPFSSPIGPLDSVPLTPWPYPYGQQTPLSAPAPYQTEEGHRPTTSSLLHGLPSVPSPSPFNIPVMPVLPQAPPNTASLPFSPNGMTPGGHMQSFEALSLGMSPSPITERPVSAHAWSLSPSSMGTIRARSNTLASLHSASSASPGTPHSGYSVYSNTTSLPYPSPRSSISSTSFTSNLLRRPSAPSLPYRRVTPTTKHIFHPSPVTFSPNGNTGQSHLAEDHLGLEGAPGIPMLGEAKPPRFKPTKEQLDILVAAYDENKNPDAQTRELLARRLGPDVRPKTLQIWFQNRRSKSRAKEKETIQRSSSHPCSQDSAASERRRSIDLAALRALAKDHDPSTLMIPLTVLSLGTWTRFLTPGSGQSSPDLASAIYTDNGLIHLAFYVIHRGETFRVCLPVTVGSIANVRMALGQDDAAAITFDLTPGMACFSTWILTERRGGWVAVGDVSDGEATAGGRCEMTGMKETLEPAFHILQSTLDPQSSAARSSLETWRFPLLDHPTSASAIEISEAATEATNGAKVSSACPPPHMTHIRQRSSSAPPLGPVSAPLHDLSSESTGKVPYSLLWHTSLPSNGEHPSPGMISPREPQVGGPEAPSFLSP